MIKYNKMPKGYGIIQTKIMRLQNLSYQAKAVYSLLASYTGSKDFCFPSINQISLDLQLSKPMIIKYIKELENKNLLIKSQLNTKNPFSNSHKYEIMLLEDEEDLTIESKPDLTYEKSTPVNLHKSNPDLTFNLNNNKDNNNNNNINKNKFIKPTINEIELYLKEKSILNVNANQFWNFYESKGWLIGKSAMKNWCAAIVTWQNNNYNKQPKEEQTGKGWD